MLSRQVTMRAPASNTTQDYTVSGFGTPETIIVIATKGATGSFGGDGVLSWGCSDDTNDYAASFGIENAVDPGTFNSNFGPAAEGFVVHIKYDATLRRQAVVSAFSTVTDGVRLTWSGGSTSERPYTTVILLKNLTSACTLFGTPNATQDASTDYTTSGCNPKLILFCGFTQTALDTAGSQPRWGLGFAYDNSSTIDQAAWSIRFRDNDPTDGNAHVSDDRCAITALSAGGTENCSLEATAMGTDQFSLTTRNGAGAGGFIALALDFSEDVLAFDSTTPTSSGAYDPFTSTFIPQWVYALPTAETTLNTSRGSAEAIVEGMGVYSVNKDGDEDGHYVVFENGSTGVGNQFSVAQHVSELIIATVTSGAADELVAGNSPTFDSTGIVYSDANFSQDSSARHILGFAVAQESAGGLTDGIGRGIMRGVGRGIG